MIRRIVRRTLLAAVTVAVLYGVASVGELFSTGGEPGWGIFGFKPFPWNCRPWPWVHPRVGSRRTTSPTGSGSHGPRPPAARAILQAVPEDAR